MTHDQTIEQAERLRVKGLMAIPTTVFVFGSNMAGRHGKGAALDARRLYGAVTGRAEGLMGRSYAIPTKDYSLNRLPLTLVRQHVKRFLDFADRFEAFSYAVTRIGCGLAENTDEDIAPMFAGAPINVFLPRGWDTLIAERDRGHARDKNSTG
jgi:hypothetical protein